MASPKAKSWRALILIVVMIGGLWGTSLVLQARDSSRARKAKREAPSLVNLGLDLQGGLAIALCPKSKVPDQCGGADSGALDKAVDIIRDRVDALGVAEPDITRQQNDVLVQIAGLTEEDQERALALIGTTAKLRFRPVLDRVPPDPTPTPRPEGVPDCADPSTYPEDVPAKELVLCLRRRDAPQAAWERLLLGPVALEGTEVRRASAQLDPQTASGWFVSLGLTGKGGRQFEDVTGKLACNPVGDPKRQFAIVLDRVIESAPQMDEEIQCNQGISGGTAIITGDFTEQEARDLALVLRYGALPVELQTSTITTVSPTLGRESLRSGLVASVIGVAIVFVYVLFFYRALGVLIWIGIGLHAAITLSVVILLGKTAGFALSLAGIAGLIISLGIAADSFIVYFERIKDEVVGGRTVRGAVERAWPSARRTIVAADLVTALAAVVLYFLAVGNVRGFALMLGIATALDLFVSYWFMHPSVYLLSQGRILSESRTLGIRAVGGGALAPGGTRA